MGASEYLIADTDRILGTLWPPGTMHKSDQLSVLAKKKVAQTEQSGVWSHCANVASREIAPAAGGWAAVGQFRAPNYNSCRQTN